MLAVTVYETLFVLACGALPLVVYQSGLTVYLVTLLVMYVTLTAVRKYKITSLSVDNKAVFISGCDTGFGHDLALQLSIKGFRVFAGCLFPEGGGASKLKEACPNNLIVVPLDVTDENSVKNAEGFVRGHLGNTDLWGLVNNAGVHCIGDIELTSLETYERVFGVNMFGMIRVTKAFLPLIRQSKGRIVAVSSIASLLKTPSVSCYAASKCALEGFADSLRMEMVKFGVKVSIVQPCAFGGNTNITVGDNLTRLYSESDSTWESSCDDVKQVYGKNYTRSAIDALLEMHDEVSCASTKPVTDCIEDCLLSSNPVYRKIVHGGPYFIDLFAVVGIMTRYMPQAAVDWLLCKICGHTDTSNLQGFVPTKK